MRHGRFFSTLGEEAARQIADLALELAGDDPPREDYLVKVGRLNMARLQAEEIVLREHVVLPPEPGARHDTSDQSPETPAARTGAPLIVDRSHPLWEQVNAEQEELASGS
jgi:hypothetical protein